MKTDLTFEKVMAVFQDFLEESGAYEIVMTSHGYTILEWDDRCMEWTGTQLCPTPESMADALIYDLTGWLEYKATLARRELTYDDLARVSVQRQAYLDKLK
ncbi:hypothetical protein [Acutalibacter sp. 1XD8-36]|jgi:hypothetical protein|uniref:hypothetical protein n=1 Tax=Acutalibacter sp. 1XD8-36 TaxID=2320852 RepID=UPI001412328E|nr:hypothetical protein [Acutalibacter sp. 1XD8-36]NBJ90839.1 hypothetical protein [Acutalibacter sp. 1XD8-36]